MKTLEFNPCIYTIKTNDSAGNVYSWDLLTLDGNTPRETVYFMRKGDSPSFNQSDKIGKAIENEEWEECEVVDVADTLSEFSIDINIFDTAGEGYETIRKELQNLEEQD